jgi:hypothetical protein
MKLKAAAREAAHQSMSPRRKDTGLGVATAPSGCLI